MHRRFIAAGVLAILAVALLAPLATAPQTRLSAYLRDLVHLPVMALATWCAIVLLGGMRLRPILRASVAAGCAAVFILAVEWLQPGWGRERGTADVVLGATGVVLAAGGFILRHKGSRRVRRLYAGLLAVVLSAAVLPAVLFGVDRLHARASFPLLSGFERPLELGRWEVQSMQLTRAPQHASEGRMAGRVEVTDAQNAYPGLFLVEGPRDWTAMRALCVDVYWPEGQEAELWIRVDDRVDQPPYADRFQKVLVLKPGANRIALGRDEVAGTPGGQPLDLSRITRLGFFLGGARPGDHFYLDNVRLERRGP